MDKTQPHQPALKRTDLAEDRTILASERTFASWIRTSLASIAVGVGFQAFFNAMEPSWVPRAIATGFLLLAAALAWLAVRRAASVEKRLSTHMVPCAEVNNLRLIAAAISLGSTGLAAAIWFLDVG